MWLLAPLWTETLFSTLLNYMCELPGPAVCWQILSSLCSASFLPAYNSHLQTSYPPKLPIKTNLFFWEIKPTFVKEWHWLQVYHCVYFMSHSISLSLPLTLHFTTALWPPPASHWRMICSWKKGSSIIWLLCALDIYMDECMISSGKFKCSFSCHHMWSNPFFRLPSTSQRVVVCQLGYDQTQRSHSRALSLFLISTGNLRIRPNLESKLI